MTKTIKAKEMTYSQALTELERIVKEIEAEEVDVDILAEKVRRASYLIRFCRDKLRTADDEVKKVISGMEHDIKDAAADKEDEAF